MLGFAKSKAGLYPRLYPRFGFDTPLFRLFEFDCFQTENFFSAWDNVWFPARQAPDFSAPPLRGFAHALFRACYYRLDRFHAAPLPQPALLFTHGLIHRLDGLP